MTHKEERLQEILRALNMSEETRQNWFTHIENHCGRHGGSKYYRDILNLVKDFRSASKGKQGRGKEIGNSN